VDRLRDPTIGQAPLGVGDVGPGRPFLTAHQRDPVDRAGLLRDDDRMAGAVGMRTCGSCGEENPERARYCLRCGRPLEAPERESRRAVTTLFCDLVSSTELAERLDAETAHRVIAAFYASAREAVERHDGTVEKFVGDAVMAVFGFPRLHEDDAVRAAAAALALRGSMDGLNGSLERDWGVVLDTRTGIATGEVLAGSAAASEPFVVGSSVNLAARLEQHAEPGQILIDEETARRIQRHADLEAVAPLALKGFDQGATAYRLLALRPGTPAPASLAPMVDRVSEVRLLEEAFRGAVSARRCRVANVVGDAGVGKSRLLQEFVSELDARVLRGRCPAYGEAASFRALAEIVAEAAGRSADDPAEELVGAVTHVAGDRSAAERVLAAVDLAPAPLSADERASTIRAFVAGLATERPLVMIVDDLHHASQPLLDALQHLVEWTRDAPILLVCAGRPELFFDRPSWGRLPGRLTLHLEPLADDDGAALVRALLPGAAPDVRRRIAEIGGGNPFFIEEIAASLDRATPDLAPDDVPVPPTITSLLEARVDRLPEEERRTLERAAILGLAFREADLASLLDGVVDGDPHEMLVRLAERDLLVPDPSAGGGGWRFRHSLIRDAAYEVVPKQVRADLHIAIAERVTDDIRAGFHLERAATALEDLGSRAPAVRQTRIAGGERFAAAGRAASARGDAGSAAALLERGAVLLPADEPARAGVLADLHHAQLYSGDIEGARSTIDDLVGALGPEDDSLLAVRARMQHAHLHFLLEPAEHPAAAFAELLTRAAARFEDEGDDRDLAAALTDLALLAWLEGDAGGMAEAAERALAAATRSDDPRAAHEAAPLLATALHRGPTPLRDVLARVEEIRRRPGTDRLTGATLQLTGALVLAQLDRGREAREMLDAARLAFRDLGQRRWLAAADEIEAEIERLEGHLARAIALKRDVHAFFLEQGDALNALPASAGLADLLLAAGEFDEADRLAAEIERQDTGEDLEIAALWMVVRAVTSARSGDQAGAAALSERALALVDGTDFLLLQADTRADLAAAAPDRGAAQRLRTDALARYESKGAVALAAELRREAREG
jgi:class 3 adenylate cyclase